MEDEASGIASSANANTLSQVERFFDRLQ